MINGESGDERGEDTALCRLVGASVDGQLLAAFVWPGATGRLAELGAGCGEVSLAVAHSVPHVVVDGLEIQPELVRIARGRLARLGLSDRVHIVVGDVRGPPSCLKAGEYDHVFANPPFFQVGRGRLPPHSPRAVARFETTGTLADFLACAVRLLRQGGRFSLIHRPERLVEILILMRQFGLVPCRLVPVQNRAGRSAVRILIEAVKGREAPLVVESAWVIAETFSGHKE